MPAVVDRKSIYKNWISEGFLILERLQDCGDTATSGCFFQPYLCKETDYSNARWQEAVLTLAMHCREYGGNEAIKQRIRSGILFWCSLQNIGGSFPQYCRGDKCFSATAFSGYAISAAIDLLGLQNINFTTEETIIVERVLKALGIWLSKNNEYVYSNQQMAASLALLMVSKVLNDEHLNQSSLKK